VIRWARQLAQSGRAGLKQAGRTRLEYKFIVDGEWKKRQGCFFGSSR